MKINNIKEALDALQKYVPNVSNYSGDNMSLDRLWPILEAVGNPQDKLKIIHIAGTSGKTSTAYYISAILCNAGKKVGLTVSPHVDSVTERLQINGVSISNDKFCSYLSEFLSVINKLDKEPSYFELLICFVYWVFVNEKVDYAVIETGMGGLLDGSNVSMRKDKVCVITDIGYDHMHILGNTLPEIANQKAGIIQQENSVFLHNQSDEIMSQITNRVEDKKARMNIYVENENIKNATKLQLLPMFQIRNYKLAKFACDYISSRDGIVLPDDFEPLSVTIPARMEIFVLKNGSELIMDGAHNQQKTEVFVESFINKFGNIKVPILISLKEGKEYKSVIDSLSAITAKFIITTFNTSQDLPAKSQDPETILEYCKQKNIDSFVIRDNKLAFKELMKDHEHPKIITGSFYLIGQIREFMKDVL